MCSSCAYDTTFNHNGSEVKGTVYGLFNQENKTPGVNYEVSVGNIVWSAILCETIIVPVILVGWYLYTPISMQTCRPGELID